MTEFKNGDKVKWKSHGGEAVGHVDAQDHLGHRGGRA